LQVASKGFTWRKIRRGVPPWSSHTLQNLFPLPSTFLLSFHVVFSSCFSIRKVIKTYFIYHFVGWKFSVFTQKFSITFLGVLQRFQQALACWFCRAALYIESICCIQHLGGLQACSSWAWVTSLLFYLTST